MKHRDVNGNLFHLSTGQLIKCMHLPVLLCITDQRTRMCTQAYPCGPVGEQGFLQWRGNTSRLNTSACLSVCLSVGTFITSPHFKFSLVKLDTNDIQLIVHSSMLTHVLLPIL